MLEEVTRHARHKTLFVCDALGTYTDVTDRLHVNTVFGTIALLTARKPRPHRDSE